ncbi:DNA polymerase II [Simiduia agarivorans]|uniref:DNA polymerase n=1 Tax=Simiduia agarivorans (strain DSM 21679 / JCM 13881 / BCRC 17597 / SA1) TaxID=1117647 RepID=K4KLI8_SIMAS|nr:DNA polymerase II [Simiduia agarivorans]AFU99085.1 DNA polymerase II [Simiduia agarivorans SA1 = DSM 21679]
MQQGFLLTRDWREGRTGLTLEFWVATPEGARLLVVSGEQSVCFFDRDDLSRLSELIGHLPDWRQQPVELCNRDARPVNALYCHDLRTQREIESLAEAAGIALWETDIRPPDRYLMERFITADVQWHSASAGRERLPVRKLLPAPVQDIALRSLSLDIETSMDGKQLFSIGIYGCDVARVYMVGDCPEQTEFELISCRDQRDCLDKFLRALRLLDPDILIGWNLVGFDLWMLAQFCQAQKLKFSLGRQGAEPRWREDAESERRYIHIPGRVALDGIDWLKAASYQFESFSLNHVSGQLLGDAKLISGTDRGGEISRLFQHDKVALARYNLQDCKLVADIFARAHLLEFVLARARLTGLPLDRVGGSVAAFEFSYLPRLHRAGYIAPNLGELESDIVSPGGYVMESVPGIYDNVLVLDFKSLYPSIIRTFLIDPCGYWLARAQQADATVPGFNGATFSREGHILPDLIAHLWNARDQAKQRGDAPLSQAIKILMNSFYGVLGSEGCRFFDPRVCSSITLRGHDIIRQSRDWIEDQGYQVIYGDTDSLFVWLADIDKGEDARATGTALAAGLNHWWREKLDAELALTSALEIEFETHFEKFFMPTIRGAETGSKKRYAGIVSGEKGRELIFKGLEAVRTDWTRLARDFQRELYWRLFEGLSWKRWLLDQVAALRAGELDAQLVYRKRLRRRLTDYTRNRPPHVQAALKLPEPPKRGDWVEYLITVNGPEPLSRQQSPLDYAHYLERQLRPVADAILGVFGERFDRLVDDQLDLF